MANEQNLVPFTSEQNREEAAKNGSKGGVASGEARRRKRDLRLAFEMLLEKEYKDQTGNLISGAEALAAKQFEKALKGDSKAFEVVRDTAGQKPIEKLEVAQIEKEQSIQELKDLFDDERREADCKENQDSAI